MKTILLFTLLTTLGICCQNASTSIVDKKEAANVNQMNSAPALKINDSVKVFEKRRVFGEEKDSAEWQENGARFRAYQEDRNNEMQANMIHLQINKGDKWIELGKYEEGKYGKEGVELEDVDRDGFADFSIQAKWNRKILMFDPKENIFRDAGDFGLQIEQIGEAKTVFYDVDASKFDGVWGSELFKFDDKKNKILLGRLESIPNEDRDFVKGIEVFKINGAKAEDKKKIGELGNKDVKPFYSHKDSADKSFDLEGFLKDYWTKHYQQF